MSFFPPSGWFLSITSGLPHSRLANGKGGGLGDSQKPPPQSMTLLSPLLAPKEPNLEVVDSHFPHVPLFCCAFDIRSFILFLIQILKSFYFGWVRAKPWGAAILGQSTLSNVMQKMKGEGSGLLGPQDLLYGAIPTSWCSWAVAQLQEAGGGGGWSRTEI